VLRPSLWAGLIRADNQDDWVTDITVAKAAGIDGFLLAIGTDGPSRTPAFLLILQRT